MKYVSQPVPKIDAAALTGGKAVYTDDIAPAGCLIVRLLRSPHAHAKIRSIHKERALQVEGVVCILTWEDVPRNRFTLAGQTYPEPSPYDRYILEDRVRYVGDPVAIVAGRTLEAADRALSLIRVEYEVLEPVLDFEEALDNPVIVHPEEDYHNNVDIGGDPGRNLVSREVFTYGDIEETLAGCDLVVEETYYTKANAQAMMETFRTVTWLDHTGRLTVVSSTQIPFHCRRIMARALGLPQRQIRVIKPRIGGGFGAKQTMVSELFPALVTLKTGLPAKIVYTREECFRASNSRHQMRLRVRLGVSRDGTVRAIDLGVLSNAGAYGEHASTTIGLTSTKTFPLYGKAEAYRFVGESVYTNTMSGGAFRGYGATQGCFAVESAVNKAADLLGMDPVELRLKNLPTVGEKMPAYYGDPLLSSAMDRCLVRGRELIGWKEKYPAVQVDDSRVRAVGMAMTMQGSSIGGVDVANAAIQLDDNGYYTLMIGASDMGTGCDTILAQMAAELMMCPLERVIVNGVDTDISPFDKGSYASSTTYLTGTAVVNACSALLEKIRAAGARLLGFPPEEADFDGESVFHKEYPERAVSLETLGQSLAAGPEGGELSAAGSFGSRLSPPPMMAGFAEIELDVKTGKVTVLDYVGVVDCGTVINPALARVQAEGGIAQGIGMALWEDVRYNERGRMMNGSFMDYKIPSRLDVPQMRVEFESSYEPSGPFGAKSIGEVVINTPCPAIAHAIHNACGLWLNRLPMTAEEIRRGLAEREVR